jgi:2-hydroxy-6-oxonona-2,4-dienedioate hydrolase
MARKKDLIKFLLILSISIGLSTSVFLQAQTGSIKGPRKFIDVDGIRTSYFEAGTGEDIVLIHGSAYGSPTGSAASFTAWFPSLSAHFHVIAVDRLGMGFTDNPKTDADYNVRAVIDHIFRFIEKKGIKKCHILGQSMGALPATRLAIEHPDLVKTLIIFDTCTLAPETERSDPGEAGAHEKPLVLTEDGVFEKLMETLHNKESLTGKVKEEWVKQCLEIALLPKTQEAAKGYELARSRFIERHPDMKDVNLYSYQIKEETHDMIRGGRLKVPTMIIWGANDTGCPEYHGFQLWEDVFQKSPLGRVQFHLYNEQNHWGWVDHPQEMTDLLVMFIRNSSSTPK